jgi:hypothetical protein
VVGETIDEAGNHQLGAGISGAVAFAHPLQSSSFQLGGEQE